ncbi:glycosyltransferase [Chromohalobacter salexigens]|nr:glycosyltransferase [Chromohalobacter salexigens]
MKALLKRLLQRAKQSHRYNAHIAARFDHALRTETTLAKSANIFLWIMFHNHQLLQRLKHGNWKLRHLSSNKSPSRQPRPWESPIGTNPVNTGITIVAELSIPQCRHYRVEQKVTMLRHLGQPTSVVSWTDPARAYSLLQTSTLVIFYRTPATQEMRSLIKEAHRLKIPTIYDIDDLVFDVEAYSLNSNLRKLPEAEQKQLLEGAQLYNEMLRLSDHAIASTPTLEQHMRPFQDGNVFIVENGLDDALCELSTEEHGFPKTEKVIIGYGSGTRTHDADFAEVTDALVSVFTENANVELAIFGHLNLPDSLAPFKSRIRRVPFINSSDYYQALRQFDINLAPLEPGVFNDSKSNIKYLEASVFGIPSIASPRETFSDIICHGKNGLLAETTQAWYEALTFLVENPQQRQYIGQESRKTVLSRYTLPSLAQRQLSSVLALSSASTPRTEKYHVMVVNVLFSPLSFGGATIVAEQMAKELNGHDDMRVTVVTGCFNGDLAPGEIRQYSWEGIPVFAIGLIGGDKETEFSNPIADACFDTIMKATQPDAVHLHSIQTLGAGITKICRSLNTPYLITLHDAWWLCEKQFMVNKNGYCGQEAIDPLVCADCVDDPALTYKRRFFLQDALSHASLLLAPSNFQRLLHVRSGCHAEKVVVNKNGVLPPMESYHDQAVTQENRPIVFAYLGGVADHKGYPWIKKIFESLEEENFQLRLVDIQARFGKSTIQKEDWDIKGDLEIAPPFGTEEMDEFYSSIDVLLFPSQWKESFGLTVREAMLRNVWVIATECGGPSEDLVSGVNGVVVDMHDTDGYRQAIIDCLENPERTREYQTPNPEKVRTFSQQAEELSHLLKATITRSRSVIVSDA